jgi:hypothetical protein
MLSVFLPRGIRNNNPGNIRLSKTIWQGQRPAEQQTDQVFAEFAAPVYGLRALMKLLSTYYLKYNLDTVENIINRFAPPHENATDNYIYCVAKMMEVKRIDKINLASAQALIALSRSIVLHENGPPPADMPIGWYSPILYDQAARLLTTHPIN